MSDAQLTFALCVPLVCLAFALLGEIVEEWESVKIDAMPEDRALTHLTERTHE